MGDEPDRLQHAYAGKRFGEENPLRAPGRQADMMGATTAAAASMMALMHREATGAGQWVDVACWQSVVNTAKIEMIVYSYAGMPYSRLRANAKAGLEPSRCREVTFTCRWVVDSHFEALKELLGHPEALESDLFKAPRHAPNMMTSAPLTIRSCSSTTWIGGCAKAENRTCR